MTYVIRLEPVCVELGTIKIKSKTELVLRKFQEETVDFFSSPLQYLFLTAPTGSGKTLTLLAPLIANIVHGKQYDGALGVYPTKPLAVDQFESLKSTLSKLSNGSVKEVERSGLTVYDVEFEVERDGKRIDKYVGKVGLVLLTRDYIKELRETLATESGRTVLDAIRKSLLVEQVDYLVTLAVPEYPYLMFSHMYRSRHDLAKILDLASSGSLLYRRVKKMLKLDEEDRLKKIVEDINNQVRRLVGGRAEERELANIASALLPPVLFFDEFHTWGFYELPTAIALVLLHRLVSLTSTRREMYRVVFSSATPDQYIKSMLENVVGEQSVREVKAGIVDCSGISAAKVRGETTIEFFAVASKPSGDLSWVEVDEHLPSVVACKSGEILESKRALVFGRRVYSVEEAARKFHEETRVTPTVVTGFMPPAGFRGKEELVAKRSSGELYVFGNYAVELGVDLQNISYSIISAASLGELIQRMGRSGRGGINSKVVILVPQGYLEKIIDRLNGANRVSYSQFVDALSWVMLDEPVVRKLGNKLIAESRVGQLRLYLPLATYVLLSILRHKDKPKDLKPVLQEFEKIMNVARIDGKFFSWLSRRVSKHPRVLVELASFRLSTSVPYARKDSQSQLDGESNPITILSNYDVEVDSTGGFKLVIRGPKKSSIRKVASIRILHPDTDILKSLDGAIVPSGLLVELIKAMKLCQSGAEKVLVEVLERVDTPIHVLYVGGESIDLLDVLHAYGHAVVLESSGTVYAYLLLL